ncbi:glycosyltransferase family protein [Halodurantibacterium flavum]|uniref:Glycosyltransferase family protein n=1 Tax=Halodurantibacterium flavum TaxID=1382802 RepID=A0ABW4RZF4_9RHOB
MTVAHFEKTRVMMYSHDTFGLGHLRRCREIAHALVAAYRGLSVMIVSGAPIAGAFDYRARVDFMKVPSIIKLRNGEYQSMAQHVSLEETLRVRRTLIRNAAEALRPDIFITDKEPLGLRGELEDTLCYLKAQGTHLVLGLRDVMDAPDLLAAEWARRNILNKIDLYYDNIWVYGPKGFYDPLVGLDLPPGLSHRMRYTGFLRRDRTKIDDASERLGRGYVLVTPGGGGDGMNLIRAVLGAHSQDPDLPRTVVVLGPYMAAKDRAELLQQAWGLRAIEIMDFDNRMEDIIANASAVVAMGGYNTFCEILSFDRPALLVPRTQPRMEQAIRADRAAALGLVQRLPAERAAIPTEMAAALRSLGKAARPSEATAAVAAGLASLDGRERIVADVGEWLEQRRRNDLHPLRIANS